MVIYKEFKDILDISKFNYTKLSFGSNNLQDNHIKYLSEFMLKSKMKDLKNIYLNEKNINRLDNFDTKVYEDDKIILFQAS